MIHRTNRWVIVIVIFLLLVSIIEATDVNMVRESAAESIRKYTETADKALAAASNLDNRIEKEYEAKEYGTAIKLLEEKIFAYQTTETSYLEAIEKLTAEYERLKKTIAELQNSIEQHIETSVVDSTHVLLLKAELSMKDLDEVYNLTKVQADITRKKRDLAQQRIELYQSLKKIADEDNLLKLVESQTDKRIEETKIKIARLRRRLGEGFFSLGTYFNSPEVQDRQVFDDILHEVMNRAKQNTLLFPIFPKCYPLALCILCTNDAGGVEDTGAIILTDRKGVAQAGFSTMAMDFEMAKPIQIQKLAPDKLNKASKFWEEYRSLLEKGNIRILNCNCFVIFSTRTWFAVKEILTCYDPNLDYILERKGTILNIYRSRHAPTSQAMLIASENIFYETGPADFPTTNTKPFLRAIGLWMSDGTLRRLDTAWDIKHMQDRLQMLIDWGGELNLITEVTTAYGKPEEVPWPAEYPKGVTEISSLMRDATGFPIIDSDNSFCVSGSPLLFGLKWLMLQKSMSEGQTGLQMMGIVDNGTEIWVVPSQRYEHVKKQKSLAGTVLKLRQRMGDAWIELPEKTFFTTDTQYTTGGAYEIGGLLVAVVQEVTFKVPYAIIQSMRVEGQKTWLINDNREANILSTIARSLVKAFRINYDNGIQVIIPQGAQILSMSKFSASARKGKQIPAVFCQAKDLKMENCYGAIVDGKTGEKTYLQAPPIGGIWETKDSTHTMAESVKDLGNFYEKEGRTEEAEMCFREATIIDRANQISK